MGDAGDAGDAERDLRLDAFRIFEAALRAVDPERLVKEALRGNAAILPPEGGRLVVVSAGKAAVRMAAGAAEALGEAIAEGVLVVPAGTAGHAPEAFRAHAGGHPLPDQKGMEAARDVHEVVRRAGPLDRILLLLSGGASALLTLPHRDVSLDDVRRVTSLLLRSGATIGEMNAVRKHIESLKGGGLAALAEPAPLLALVLSDVVGDPPDVIASGPVSPDRSTFADAIRALEEHGLWHQAPEPVRTHLVLGREGEVAETPREGDAIFAGVEVRIVGNAELAARGAVEEARGLGYGSRIGSAALTGEAREVGRALARDARELLRSGELPACVVSAGETTVTVRGDGLGGRNQEVALGAALELDGEEGVLVFAAGTDGIDGPTEAAGAVATGSTVTRAREAGIDPSWHLDRNDAYRLFEALGDLVITGPTGTNVMDLMLILARAAGRP